MEGIFVLCTAFLLSLDFMQLLYLFKKYNVDIQSEADIYNKYVTLNFII